MTELLKDMMNDRAGSLDAPDLDVLGMVREGNRRVQRRRTGVLGAGVAAAVVAAIAVPTMLTNDRDTARELGPASAFATPQPAWAIGSTVHVGDEQFDVGHPVSGLFVTTAGMVFADDSGTVYASDGTGAPAEIGTADPSEGRLLGDGSRAAWIEPRVGAAPEYTVYDQETGEVARSAFQTGDDGATEYDTALFAVDGNDVYFRDSRGIVRWDVESDVQTSLGRPMGADIQDVKSGVIAHSLPVGDSVSFYAGTSGGAGGPLDVIQNGALNPSGTKLLASGLDADAVIVDTATGEITSPVAPGYDEPSPYAWVDDDTYVATATRATGSTDQQDLLTCDIGGGCTVAYADFAGESESVVFSLGYAGPGS
jgi:hypothetical protein